MRNRKHKRRQIGVVVTVVVVPAVGLLLVACSFAMCVSVVFLGSCSEPCGTKSSDFAIYIVVCVSISSSRTLLVVQGLL
jgi:hypothetical protein